MHYNSLFIRYIKAWFFIVIKRALWLEKPQHSSDFPASYLSPPWERQGEAPQVQAPLLGRGRGRLLKSALPSLGEAGEGPASQLSSPWERQGKAPQVGSPLLGRGRGRLRKLALPSLGEGLGVGFCYFLLQNPLQDSSCWEANALRSEIREFWACLQRIDYENVMKNKTRYSVKTWQKALQSASF